MKSLHIGIMGKLCTLGVLSLFSIWQDSYLGSPKRIS